MEVRTFGDLIDWTRQLHEHLASCLAHCATEHEEERAQMLLNYLAAHEAEMQRVVARLSYCQILCMAGQAAVLSD